MGRASSVLKTSWTQELFFPVSGSKRQKATEIKQNETRGKTTASEQKFGLEN